MIISSVSENRDLEKRISITPEIAKKYIGLGFKVQLSKNYGKHLGFEDKQYSDFGATFIDNDKSIIENSGPEIVTKSPSMVALTPSGISITCSILSNFTT